MNSLKYFKYLIPIFFLVIISCSNDDDDNQACKISTITYGEVINGNVYNVIYENDQIITMESDAESVHFTYDADGHLASREFFTAEDPQVQVRTIFKVNSFGKILETKNWRYQNETLGYTGRDSFYYYGSDIIEIRSYRSDDITRYKTLELFWIDQNPTFISTRDGSGEIDFTFEVTYNLSKLNKFNSTFKNFMFYDFFDTEFNIYQSLSLNTVSSATFIKTSNDGSEYTYTDNYNYTLLANGLTDQITFNDNLLWDFEYDCD